MRKKYLSALLFGALVMASTVTFTSCIDNDEPAGIENLRGAKAELLRAKVAVEQADAAYKLAQAEHEKANATYRLAEARWMEAEAKKKEAEAAQAEAKTEADKAYYAQQAAFYKNLMEEQAEIHKATMVQKQQAYAEAVRAYEVALKQIEIAKALMSDKEKVSIESLQAIIEGGTYTTTNGNTVTIQPNESLKYKLEQAISDVETKEEKLYNAMMEKAQYGSWTGNGITHQYEQINKLELELSRAKAELEAAKEAEANMKDALSQGTETLNWKAEIEELEDSIAGLDVLKAEYDIKIAKLQNSDEFQAAKQAAKDAVNALTSTNTTEEYKYVFKFNSAEDGENTAADVNNYWEVKVDKDIRICDNINPDATGANTALGILNASKDVIKVKLAAYTTEKQAMLDEYAADAEGKVETAKKKYDAAVKAWKAAIEKYDKAKDYKGGTGAGSEYATVMKAIDDNWANTYDGNVDVASGAKSKIATALATYYTNAAVVDLVTNEVQVTMGGQNVKKTVLAFLSDADYKVAYLNLLATKFNGSTFTFSAGNKDAFKTWFVMRTGANVAIKSMSELGNINIIDPATISVDMTNPNISQQLVIESKKAFGTALLTEGSGVASEKYMRVEPTAAEVEAVGFNAGAAGLYHQYNSPSFQFRAKNYKAIMADYKAAIESIDAEIEKIYETLADLKTAAEEATAAFQEYKDAKKALETEQAGVTARITALGKVKAALLKAFVAIEGDSNGNLTIPDGNGGTRVVSIDEYLQYCVEDAENDVIKAEKTVAEAEVALQMAKDGKYDGVASAQKALDKANEALKAAQEAYDKAVADLKTALEIMAQSAE